VQGAIGAPGAQGIQGTIGAPGAQGVQGSVGAPGAQGVQGTIGVQGAIGAPGAQGVQGAIGVGAPGAQGVQGAPGGGAGSTALDDLTDVVIGGTALTTGDVLLYDGTQWINSPDVQVILSPVVRQTTQTITPISVGTTAPLSPAVGDLWVDTN
jgi:hypothetical protein